MSISVKQTKFWPLRDANFQERTDKLQFDFFGGVWIYLTKTTRAGPQEPEVKSNRIEFHSKYSAFVNFSESSNQVNSYMGGNQSVLVLSPDENEEPFFDTSWIKTRDFGEADVDYEIISGGTTQKDETLRNEAMSKAFEKIQNKDLGGKTVYDYIDLLNQFPFNEFGKQSDGKETQYNINYQSLVGLRINAEEYINKIEEAEVAKRNKDNSSNEEFKSPFHDKFLTEERKDFFMREVLAGLAKLLYTEQLNAMRTGMRTWFSDYGAPSVAMEYISRVLHPAARTAVDAWIKKEMLNEDVKNSFDSIGSTMTELVKEVITPFLKMENSEVWNDIFKDFDGGMTLENLIEVRKINRGKALNTRHHLKTQKSNRYILFNFTGDEEIPNEDNQEKIDSAASSIKNQFKIIFPQVVEAFKQIPITLDINKAKKIVEETTAADAKTKWRMKIYESIDESFFESKFSADNDSNTLIQYNRFGTIVEDYLLTYFMNFAMLDYEEIMLRYLSRSPDLEELEMTNFNNTENMDLLRLLLYSVGSLDFNKSLDTRYIGYEDMNAIVKSRLLLV
jgi:hypothetical protein